MTRKNLIQIYLLLKCNDGQLELVFGDNFYQLHKFSPTIVFPKVQVQSTRPEAKLTQGEREGKDHHMWMWRFTNTLFLV